MVELTVRIAFSLLIVLGLMWGIARLARRPLRGRRGGLVTVLGRQQLSKGAAVAVVRIVDRAIVVGVTDAQVTLLGEADLHAVEEYQPEQVIRRQALPLDQLSLDQLSLGQLSEMDGGRSARSAVRLGEPGGGPLAGSLLSPAMWSQTLRVVRERAGRRA
jgi:flagellar protein FliO/FliZ